LSASEAVNYAIGLGSDHHQPLTIRDLKESRTKSHTFDTVDPATTSLSHAPTPAPAAKRQRLRRPTSSVDLHSNYDFTSHDLDNNDGNEDHHRHHTHSRSFSVVSATSPNEPVDGQSHLKGEPSSAGPYSAAEDKRRRNTLASARFRLKKKEREAAMEKKAKELDDKVSELERECESLKKENQWLKGLVVGATNGESVLGSNHGSTLTGPANGLVSTTQTPSNGLNGTAITNFDAAKGALSILTSSFASYELMVLSSLVLRLLLHNKLHKH
jgi:hypothetical protein